jgi:hypothetical protein
MRLAESGEERAERMNGKASEAGTETQKKKEQEQKQEQEQEQEQEKAKDRGKLAVAQFADDTLLNTRGTNVPNRRRSMSSVGMSSAPLSRSSPDTSVLDSLGLGSSPTGSPSAGRKKLTFSSIASRSPNNTRIRSQTLARSDAGGEEDRRGSKFKKLFRMSSSEKLPLVHDLGCASSPELDAGGGGSTEAVSRTSSLNSSGSFTKAEGSGGAGAGGSGLTVPASFSRVWNGSERPIEFFDDDSSISEEVREVDER